MNIFNEFQYSSTILPRCLERREASKIEQYRNIHCIVFLSCTQPIIWEIQFRVAPWYFCQHAQYKLCAMSLYIPGCITYYYDTTFFIFILWYKKIMWLKLKIKILLWKLLDFSFCPSCCAPSSRREPELTTTVTIRNTHNLHTYSNTSISQISEYTHRSCAIRQAWIKREKEKAKEGKYNNGSIGIRRTRRKHRRRNEKKKITEWSTSASSK